MAPQTDPNSYITTLIAATESPNTTRSRKNHTELDSHANMVVLGNECFVFEKGGTCSVKGFAPGLQMANIPVVDAALAYDDPYTGISHILIVRNALYVKDMEHNLVPPFILREAGLDVKTTPKVQCKYPTVENHSIYSKEHDLRIPLKLSGIFSYFITRRPHMDEISNLDADDVVLLTPDSVEWDPYSNHWEIMEDSMLDDNGEMTMVDRRKTNLIPSKDEEDNNYRQLVSVSTVEAIIDSTMAYERERGPFTNVMLKGLENSMRSISMNESEHDDLFSPLHTTLDELETTFGGELSFVKAGRPSKISPEFLSKIWSIKEDEAERVLEENTMLRKQPAANDLSRRFGTSDRRTRYRRIRSNFFTDTFFVDKRATTVEGYTCMQLFVSDKGYVAVYPMVSKGQFNDALKLFCKEVGVPERLVLDPSGEQSSRKSKQTMADLGIKAQFLEESTQWANRAELYIGLFKEQVRKDLRKSQCPLVLWNYCTRRRALINNLTPKTLFQCEGKSSHELTMGEQGDISNLLFDWYEWVYYRERSNVQFPFQVEKLGRCLGPTKDEGNDMCQSILTDRGKVVPRRTVRPLTIDEINNEKEIKLREDFDLIIQKKLGDHMSVAPKDDANKLTSDDFLDDEEGIGSKPFWIDGDPIDGSRAKHEQPILDQLIGMEVNLPQMDELRRAKIIRKSTGPDGEEYGHGDPNPLLSTLAYDVKFDDGEIKQVSANIIAQHMHSQVDADGHISTLLDGILDYSTDGTEVKKPDSQVTTPSGLVRERQSTRGWYLKVKWKDGSMDWVPLQILKESNPIEVADFAQLSNIADEPAFKWWVPHVLEKRSYIASKVDARLRRKRFKYGLEVPNTLEDAIRIDAKNGNTMWADATAKEMETIKIAFTFLKKGENPPPGWEKSDGHIVYDVKMDFTRKGRWVKNGYLHDPPVESSFAGVVSRETVRICLTYAALNELNVMCCDIKSAYLQSPSSEKHYIICGDEFGEHSGCVALIKRALYGGKSSGADYWKTMRACMNNLHFKSCQGDPDLWMRQAQKDDGTHYWEYVCLYTDDALVISMNPELIIKKQIGKYWDIKEESIQPPSIYLGNKVSKLEMANGVQAWGLSSSQYTQAAVANVEKHLAKNNMKLPKKTRSPLSDGYRPELDTTPELGDEDASYYMSLIGILRWIVELNRIDIAVEVSMMASVMAMPRRGHLEQLYHIFAFLKIKHNAELVLDPTIPEIDESCFERKDWQHTVYGEVKEDVISNSSPHYREPRGLGFVIRAYVDSDHAGESVTRRSRTGYVVLLNKAPIYWFTKKQIGIETSSFGSEFTAMKQCCEYLRGLRFKLRSMGIPVDLPSMIYGDNKSVLTNSSQPFSVLKKKSNSIAYHFVREGTAKDEWRIAYVNTNNNCADMLTKPSVGIKRKRFTNMLLYHVYPDEGD